MRRFDVVWYLLQGVTSVEERLRRVRDALRREREALAKEKEAHEATKREPEELKEAVALSSAVEDILEFARMQRSSTDICSPKAGVQAGPSSQLVPSDVADTMALG